MLNDFIHRLQCYDFTAKEIEVLISKTKQTQLASKQIITKQDDMTDNLYFLIDGICHASYLTEHGKQFSKEFYWQGDWIICFESLVNNQTSPYTLETITPVTLLSIPISFLKTWRAQSHPFYLQLLETQLMYKEKKERFMLLYSPQEKYQIFCQTYPALIEKLTDYQIAAYLGITHISLSRIKGRIKNKLT